jgi:hypothetical protein
VVEDEVLLQTFVVDADARIEIPTKPFDPERLVGALGRFGIRVRKSQ